MVLHAEAQQLDRLDQVPRGHERIERPQTSLRRFRPGVLLLGRPRAHRRHQLVDVVIVKQLEEPALLHRLVHRLRVQHQLQELEQLRLEALFALDEQLHDTLEQRVLLLLDEERPQRAGIVVQRRHEHVRPLELRRLALRLEHVRQHVEQPVLDERREQRPALLNLEVLRERAQLLEEAHEIVPARVRPRRLL